MDRRAFLLFLIVFVLGVKSPASSGQSLATGDGQEPKGSRQVTPSEIQAALKAHQGDFDYLLGDWEFTGLNPKGKFRGVWSAVRLPETGQILDEFRIFDNDGGTACVSITLRAYNAVQDRWELVSVDNRGTGLQNFGTAHRAGEEIRIEQIFGIGTDNSWISRIRYYNIQSDRFSWTKDHSVDSGKTWIKDYQQIEAHRIGPPRSLSPLTLADKARVTDR